MTRSTLLDDDEGVTHVIAVILLLGITVVLALVMVPGTLEAGTQPQDVPPNARFELDYDPTDHSVLITHEGGDKVVTESLYVRGQGINDSAAQTDLWGPNNDRWAGTNSSTIDGEKAVTVKDTAEIQVSASGDHVVRVVWQGSDADATAELAVHRGPASS